MFNFFKRKEDVRFDNVKIGDLTLEELTELDGFVKAIPGLKEALYGSKEVPRTVNGFNLSAYQAILNAFLLRSCRRS